MYTTTDANGNGQNIRKATKNSTKNWEFYVPRIIKQAMFEKGATIEKIRKEIGITEDDIKIYNIKYTTYIIVLPRS